MDTDDTDDPDRDPAPRERWEHHRPDGRVLPGRHGAPADRRGGGR